jgi:hypothetical protein
MREPRIKIKGVKAIYHISNEIHPDLPVLTWNEQNELEKVLIDTARFCRIKILTYTVYNRGYAMLIRIPAPSKVSDKVLGKNIAEYFGDKKRKIFESASRHISSYQYRDLSRRYREKLFDLHEFVRLFAQRYSRSYNRRHSRSGTLWRQRFRSYVVQNDRDILQSSIAYILTRPVAQKACTAPAQCKASSWAKALKGDNQWRRILQDTIKAKNWKSTKEKTESLFEIWSKRINKPFYGSSDHDLVEKYLARHRKTPERLKKKKKEWDRMYNRRQKYGKENGHFLFPWGSAKHRDLIKWVGKQRAYKQRGKLGEDRVMALEKIGFSWERVPFIADNSRKSRISIPSKVWMQRFKMLQKFHKKNGAIKPPYGDRIFTVWISYLRRQFKDGRLSQDKIDMLNSIDFQWSSSRSNK